MKAKSTRLCSGRETATDSQLYSTFLMSHPENPFRLLQILQLLTNAVLLGCFAYCDWMSPNRYRVRATRCGLQDHYDKY